VSTYHGVDVPREQWLPRLEALFAGRRLVAVERRENDWLFTFEGDRWLRTDANWRLLGADSLLLCADDHGHPFGLPAPLDGAARVLEIVGSARIHAVRLGARVPDLLLEFEDGHLLEVPLDSCGYEAWEAGDGAEERWVAGGGGRLWRVVAKPS